MSRFPVSRLKIHFSRKTGEFPFFTTPAQNEIKSLTFDNDLDAKNHLQRWALENGFELSKTTGTKSYAFYMKCSKSGKPRKFTKSEGKRSKPLKKQVNFLLILITS